jgi:hypothetical protein
VLTQLRVTGLVRKELERQPYRGIFGRLLGGLFGQGSSARRIILVVQQEEGLLEQRTRALRRAHCHLHQAIQQLAEVLVGLAPLDDGDQAFEWLGEVRFDVDRGQLITRGGGLVTLRFLEDAHLVKQDRLPHRRRARRLFRAQVVDRRNDQRRILRRRSREGCPRPCRARHGNGGAWPQCEGRE